MRPDLRESVARLLAELGGCGGEDALCPLRSLPETLPLVTEAYHREVDGRQRQLLVRCLWQYRDVTALPTLAAALRDPDDGVWKEALDGIVTLGSEAALRVLHEARAVLSETRKPSVRGEWIDEAIDQLRQCTDPR